MRILSTALATSVFVLSVGCQRDKHASRTAGPRPVVASSQVSYAFDESFYSYFRPHHAYVFDQSLRGYLGPNADVALQEALREAHPEYQIQIDFADSAK